MNSLGTSTALAVIIGWVVCGLAGWFTTPLIAAGLGLCVGAVSVVFFRNSIVVGGLVALLAPFGLMLPALAVRHIVESFGVSVAPFDNWELLVFLVVYIVFLASSFNVVPVDLYRFGYAPVPVAVMVLSVCVYAFWTGHLFLAAVAVLGQLFWVLGWGSSNWFDHVLHAILVPVAAVVLALQLF